MKMTSLKPNQNILDRKSFPTRPGVWVYPNLGSFSDVFPCDSRQACRQVSLPRPSLDLPSEEFWGESIVGTWRIPERMIMKTFM